ncbi:hypothetical protein [Urbifossiella limnaea]|uniref:Uncharacterized protein n=1 Tax=Urbifossiella limnaea TaxID=2528023 RepID=A0A517XT95_9BACT|nr:hypothetical protein [Urbifossiella limnaea]QDU20749.1 hypothetical protein ETAA1_27090 [Urbifossiella limnaea]
MSTASYPAAQHPYGLPMGTVRGFMSLLICSFFWIFLLLPDSSGLPHTAPLGHFFLLTLVFMAFASHQHTNSPEGSEFLPWIIRIVFVFGSIGVVGYTAYAHPDRLATRLTPNASELGQWPVLLGTLSAGFAVGLLSRKLMGRNNNLFMTIRGWTGVIASLLLIAETVFQFAIRPSLSEPPSDAAMKVWEGVIIAFVSAYFGTRV